jgi:hypothetical protein
MTAPKTKEPMDVILEYTQQRIQEWSDAAECAELRNEHATAIFFRNAAWRIANGKEWLDDVTLQEQK